MHKGECHRVVIQVALHLEPEVSPSVIELLVGSENVTGLVVFAVLEADAMTAIDLDTSEDAVTWNINSKLTCVFEWCQGGIMIPNTKPRSNSKCI